MIERAKRILGYTVLTLTICPVVFAQLSADQIRKLQIQRSSQLASILPSSKGSDRDRVALTTIFSEQAILSKAQNLGIKATSSEVENFLVPLLARQGLIAVDGKIDLKSDANVEKWLKGQNWDYEKLYHSGEVLLLWAKISTRNVAVTAEAVRDYVSSHPEVSTVQERIRVKISQFDVVRNDKSVARGILQAGEMSPQIFAPKKGVSEVQVGAHKSVEWAGLNLYLEINRLDPILRKDLEGKKVGDDFGPITLSDGSVISGSILSLLNSSNLTKSPEFWQYATLLTKLQKADQKQEFDAIAKDYFNGIKDPAVKGLFGDFFSFAGAAVGSVFGGLGAPIGGVIGSTVGNWLEGALDVPDAARSQSSGMFPTNPFQNAAAPYLASQVMSMPPIYQTGYPQPSPLNYVPQMPQYYPSYQQMCCSMNYAQQNYPWGPPIYYPMPIYSYYY